MARPTKYTPELTKRIKRYISDGLTIRDVCFGVGISEDTFCRWRRTKPEFAKLVQEATEAQAWSSLALARTSEYRRYTRKQKAYKIQQKRSKWVNTCPEVQNALKTALNAPQSYSIRDDMQSPAFKFGVRLETRTSPPVDDFGELVQCEPYFNPTTNKVEWMERETFGELVFHCCSAEKWMDLISKHS